MNGNSTYSQSKERIFGNFLLKDILEGKQTQLPPKEYIRKFESEDAFLSPHRRFKN